VELYLHSPNTPSWRGAQLKKSHGQLYLVPCGFCSSQFANLHRMNGTPLDSSFKNLNEEKAEEQRRSLEEGENRRKLRQILSCRRNIQRAERKYVLTKLNVVFLYTYTKMKCMKITFRVVKIISVIDTHV
jgi:hypothetical protein